MKPFILLSILLFVFATTATAADYVTKGAILPYEGICFEESVAETLLGDIVTLKPMKNQNSILKQEVEVCKQMNTNYVTEIDAYKTANTALNETLNTQIDITKQAAKDCKTLIDNAKPSWVDDLKTLLVGVGIGVLITLL